MACRGLSDKPTRQAWLVTSLAGLGLPWLTVAWLVAAGAACLVLSSPGLAKLVCFVFAGLGLSEPVLAWLVLAWLGLSWLGLSSCLY